jgi:transcriptional regulator with XRE-family HTH domain
MTTRYSTPDVGRRLAAARLQRGLSQSTVARLSGLAPSYVSRVENGKIQPSLRMVTRMQKALDATAEEILGPSHSGHRSRDGACPVSSGGRCLLDLMRPEAYRARGGAVESFTPREIRLLRSVAAWLRGTKPDRVQALEVLMEDLNRGLSKPAPR